MLIECLLTRWKAARRRCKNSSRISPKVEPLEVRQLLAAWSGEIPNGTVWTNAEIQRIVGDVHIPAGSTLTIQPGTIIKFNEFAGFDISVDGTLNAQGTAAQPIYFTSLRDDTVGGDTGGDGSTSTYGGQWDSITWNAGSTGSILDHVEVRYGGGNNPGSVLVNGGSLTMTNSTVLSSSTAGVRIQNSNPTLSSITLQNNNIAASMDLASNPAFSSVTLTNNSVNALRVDGGTLPGNATWNDPAIAYLVQDTVTVPAGVTLSVAAGQVVKFREFGGVGITVNGTLAANGTSAAPVIFTSTRDDSVGGDAYNNGETALYGGQWDALTFNSTSSGNILDHAEVRYGGANRPGAVLVDGGPLSMANSKVLRSSTSGIRIQNSNPTLSNITLESNTIAASMDLASNPAITSATLTTNAVNALRVDGGSLPGNAFWNDPDIAYLVQDLVTIPAGVTLSVAAGQIVKFREFGGVGITVNGTLAANGTALAPVIFTTTRDDSVGGDAYNDGETALYGGQWDALTFSSASSANVLDHVELRYGGGNAAGSLVVNGGPLTLTNSKVLNSSTAGVRIQNSNPTITGVTFKDNSIAASMDLGSNPAISAVTLTTNGTNALRVDGGALPGNGIWNDPAIPYLLQDLVTVPAGRSLSIAAGQIVKMREFAGVGITVNGRLTATGTTAAPVIFTTSRDDSVGGDVYKDGQTLLYGGQWDALTFNGTSTANVLDHVELRYGGGNAAGSVLVNGGPLTLTNSKVLNSSTSGVRIQNSNPTIAGITLRDNSIAASMDLGSNPAITAATLMTNGTNALRVDGGTLNVDAFWDDRAIPYLLQDALTVAAGKKLSIAAGQIVKMREFATVGINVIGTLAVNGTAGSPVIFTSSRDDSVGGDAYQDGQTALYGGQWDSLTFNNSSTGNVLNHAELRYGGANSASTVLVNGGPLTFTGSKVYKSSTAGLRVLDAVPTVTEVVFQDNAGAAISLNLAADVASSGISGMGNGRDAIAVDGGTLSADRTWAGDGLPYQLGGHVTLSAGVTLTIAANATFDALEGASLLGTGTLNNDGKITKTAGTAVATIAPPVVNTGSIQTLSGTLRLAGGLANNGAGALTGPIGPTLAMGKDLTGNTQNQATFAPLSTVLFNGSGTAAAPQLLEALSSDQGATGTGFSHNLAFYSLSLTNGTYVKLVDQSNNVTGSGAEAVYVSKLVISSGTTLNLNGLHLYTRTSQIDGMVTGGTISIVPDGGPLGLDAVTPGSISAVGQVDDWTIFGRAGQSLTITLGTGTGGTTPPGAPTLDFGQIKLLSSTNQLLGTASNVQSGADVSLAGITLPADGTYHIRIQAPTAQASSTGNYVLTAWNATVNIAPLELNRTVYGNIDTPYRVDRWTFSAIAGQVLNFNLVNAENSSIQFDLTGPNGYTGFSNRTDDVSNVTLPASGTYSVSVHTVQQQTGKYAFRLDPVTVTPIALGATFNGTLAGGSQSQVFKVNVAQSAQLAITLTDPVSADRNEVYVKFGSAPTRADYQYKFSSIASANQQVHVPSAAPGDWYILVYSEAAPQPGTFALKVAGARVFLTSVTPDHAGNAANMTLTVTGVGFDSTSTVSLVSASNTTYAANAVQFDTAAQLTATFNAGAVPAGTYTLRVTQSGGGTASLANAFTVVQGGQAKFAADLVIPDGIGYHIPSVFYINYRNEGDVAMPAPMLFFTPTQTHADNTTTAGAFMTLDGSAVTRGFWTSALPAGFSSTIEILASGATPGILQPGESVQVPVYYAGWQQPWDFAYPAFHFNLKAIQADNPTPMDWADLKSQLAFAPVAPAAWDVIWANLQTQMGNTWGSYVAALDQTASYLGQLGENVNDIGELLSFEMAQANGLSLLPNLSVATDAQSTAPGLQLTFSRSFPSSVSGRYHMGPLGLGWTWAEGWDSTLAVQSDGAVVLTGPAGEKTRFLPDSRGGYFSQAGDTGQLIAGGGGTFTIKEQDGSVAAYRADGRLDSMADARGNRVTTTFTGGRLTQLTHSSGQTMTFAYNSAGRIISVTDAVGRITRYAYDAGNQHLLSVTAFDGTVTSYTYDVGGSAATKNALLSVTSPDGIHTYFSYDARGRLSNTHLDGNAENVQYTYGVGGKVSATGATGGTTTVYFDNRGQIGKLEDALHRTSFLTYDNVGNIISTTDATGQISTFTYDAQRRLTRSTDPLGHTVQFSYDGTFGQVSTIVDPKGNATRYGYDSSGDVTSRTYADGSVEQMAYDPVGNLIRSTDRKGQATQYTYDSSGRLLSMKFADNSQATYAYDAHGNLTSAADATGTTTLTYDAKDRLTQIAYPGARFLNYTYDAAGRRTKMTDQTGFVVNYSYDSIGRLSVLRDGQSNNIAVYTYDAASRLVRKNNGNGTYTTYEYNQAGELLHQVNFTPGSAVSSRFDYTYDLLGRIATMSTVDGIWTYRYDAIGELTRAVFASNNPGAVPNQDLQYSYDAAGNRTRTVFNGVTTQYVTNNLNQYTSIGTAVLQYDANGNLIQKTDGAVTTKYTYDLKDQLVGVTAPGNTWSYQYDPFGNQVAATHNGQTTRNLIDPRGFGNIVAQFSGAGTLLAHYTYGLGLASRVDATNASAYYNFDGMANTVALTGPTGSVLNSYRYLPQGTVLTTSGAISNPFQFAGEVGVQTLGNGLDFMRARSYDPATGRFTQADPIGIVGSLNLYAYAGNDPVNQLDPSGLAPTVKVPVQVVATTAEVAYEQFLEILASRLYNAGVQMNGFVDCQGATLFKPKILDILKSMNKREVLGIARDYFTRAELRSVPGLIETTGAKVLQSSVGAGAAETAVETATTAGRAARVGRGILTGIFLAIWYEIFSQGTDYAIQDHEWKKSYDDWWYKKISGEGDAATGETPTRVPRDPNEKIGPSGYGTQGFTTADNQFPYRIDFENDKDATAPAQNVTISDRLSTNLDWNSFQLSEIGFGDTLITVPPGNQHYQTTVPVTFNGKSFDVLIEAGLRSQTGEVYATYQSIDPKTSLPPDVLTGFLPPEDGTGRGKGHVSYIIRPKANLATGTQIRNVALITFDINPAIATNQVDPHDPGKGTDTAKEALSTIDAAGPTSRVTALPSATQGTAITVRWSGSDDTGGSGVGSYDVYVSNNNGPYQRFVNGSKNTSATYTGTVGHTYRFYSVATDNVGHREAAPATADAATTLSAAILVTPASSPYTNGLGGTQQFSVRLSSAPRSNVVVTLSVPAAGGSTPEGTLSKTVLTFTTSNWNIPQAVTVAGNENSTSHGYTPFKVHAVVTSTDPAYASSVIADQSFTNIAGLARVYNIVNTDYNVHFYTTNLGERDALLSLVNNFPAPHHPWQDDRTDFTSFALFQKSPGGTNVGYVQRLYNSETSEHYYTGSVGEATALSNLQREDPPGSGHWVAGWVWENRSQREELTAQNAFQGYMYMPNNPADDSTDNPVGPAGTLGVFRLYQLISNPIKQTGDHTLTNDPALYTDLRSRDGWVEHSMVGFAVQIESLEESQDPASASATARSMSIVQPNTGATLSATMQEVRSPVMSLSVPTEVLPAVAADARSYPSNGSSVPLASDSRAAADQSPATGASTSQSILDDSSQVLGLDEFWESVGGDIAELLEMEAALPLRHSLA